MLYAKAFISSTRIACGFFSNRNKIGGVLIVTLRRKPNRFEHGMLG